jgi:hypothetical protein
MIKYIITLSRSTTVSLSCAKRTKMENGIYQSLIMDAGSTRTVLPNNLSI